MCCASEIAGHISCGHCAFCPRQHPILCIYQKVHTGAGCDKCSGNVCPWMSSVCHLFDSTEATCFLTLLVGRGGWFINVPLFFLIRTTSFFKKILLKYSWFTISCKFQVCCTVIQLYIHIWMYTYIRIFSRFFSLIGYYFMLLCIKYINIPLKPGEILRH